MVSREIGKVEASTHVSDFRVYQDLSGLSGLLFQGSPLDNQ